MSVKAADSYFSLRLSPNSKQSRQQSGEPSPDNCRILETIRLIIVDYSKNHQQTQRLICTADPGFDLRANDFQQKNISGFAQSTPNCTVINSFGRQINKAAKIVESEERQNENQPPLADFSSERSAENRPQNALGTWIAPG
ncbi:MAG: hypothetical protein ACU0DI_05460 [Paracoccaceae bacterium]